MKKVLVFNYSEISLKKKNRKYFEDKVFAHIKKIADFYSLGKTKSLRGRFYIEVRNEENLDSATDRFQKVFGLQSVFLGYKTEKEVEKLVETASKLVKEQDNTFKIKAKRTDKSFKLNSMELNQIVGSKILELFPKLNVDVHHPDAELIVEIHKDFAFVMRKLFSCSKGLPYASSGKVVTLLSGGIDSPVATWMMMKRGCEVIPVHFHTPPYTGDSLVKKIKDIAKVLSYYANEEINLHLVNFTEIQVAIKKFADDKFTTILSRRFMLKIAEEIAVKNGAKGIVTGDALGQVASQTLENIMCINEVAKLPVLRPLIGFDKDEIENIAKKIRTYEISITEGIDCCHLFSPKNPETKGKIDAVVAEERKVIDALGEKIPYNYEIVKISPYDTTC
ncbi:tRNA 4-thiouridine(8) synthase ThiI [Deferribacter autotrophicus]|uniref:Probable tRNA sulfurtransferase n=1 Tax=Deferribacter autotrophicus TaxID=500465 RepID=A0A5A8F348_9BACT|nr:tRNA uracil 4-sulfurtransferase ThiI [Deferribacter autotrophicus]KAA0258555.1 tRNA 4-thiouridine(8) synthase ThiI [Deferribacter autotrophicus]